MQGSERDKGVNTESDVEDEKRICVSDIWRTRSPKVRHLSVSLFLSLKMMLHCYSHPNYTSGGLGFLFLGWILEFEYKRFC